MIKRQQKGFTIVELLVVIVIIGILAAVTIVTYSGIQTRAENTKTVAAVETYINAAMIYANDNKAFPTNDVVAYYCLGGTSLADGCGANGSSCTGVGPVSGSNQAFLDKFKTVLSSLPEASKQRINCSGAVTGNGILYYSAAGGTTASLIYFLKDASACPSPGGIQPTSPAQVGNARSCWLTLTLPS